MPVLHQSFTPRLGVLLVLLMVVTYPAAALAQQTELEIKVDDVYAFSGQQNVVIPIYMSNYFDTVAAFQLWMLLDRPDIAIFQTDTGTVVDTTYWEGLEWDGPVCIDSVLTYPFGEWDFIHVDTSEVLISSVDTIGTLCSGWEYIDARSLGVGFDLQIAGIADLPVPPTTTGIPPQEGGVLIKILADIFEVPDTLSDRVVNILEPSQFLCFADPNGECIGYTIVDSVLDTTFFRCTVWAGEDCLNWIVVPDPPCDSMVIEWVPVIVLDTASVVVNGGSITILPSTACGDVNFDGHGPNVADVTYFVDYLFREGPTPPIMEATDVNNDDRINVADVTYLVDHLFRDGPAPVCW